MSRLAVTRPSGYLSTLQVRWGIPLSDNLSSQVGHTFICFRGESSQQRRQRTSTLRPDRVGLFGIAELFVKSMGRRLGRRMEI